MSLGPGGKPLLVLAGLPIIGFTLQHYGLAPALRPYYLALTQRGATHPLAIGDFPPGAIAPEAEITAQPPRPVRVGMTPRAGAASLLVLSGGPGRHPEGPAAKAYAVD